MLVKDVGFPYEQLTAQDKKWVGDICGGSPLRDRNLVRQFMQMSGRPLLGGAIMREFLDDVAWRSINSVDMHSRGSLQAFNRGLLFYAGVLGEVSGVSAVTFDEHVLGCISDADAQSFALESLQIVRERVPSYCELAEEGRPALDTVGDDRLHEVLLMGSGALHLMVTQSLDALTSSDADALNAAFGDFADLQGLADQLGE